MGKHMLYVESQRASVKFSVVEVPVGVEYRTREPNPARNEGLVILLQSGKGDQIHCGAAWLYMAVGQVK
jgi:hypothetical protein